MGRAASGRAQFVTGRAPRHDVDGGRTSVRSPSFRLPQGGKARLQLRYWVGLGKSATAEDGLRIHLVDDEREPPGTPARCFRRRPAAPAALAFTET